MPTLPSQSGAPVLWRATEPDRTTVARLSGELGCDPLVARMLARRGLEDLAAARDFLEPSVDDLLDPFGLADMERAAARVSAAVADRQPVLVYGDADVDGLAGTALLSHFLRFLGAEPTVYVPNRAYEGYSFTDTGVDEILARGAKVVISVDNGVSSVDAIARLQAAGVDVIVTDHHLPPDVLPPAHAVVNPRRVDCGYPFKGLAGVGVAFKLACAVASRLGEGKRRSPEMSRFLGEAMGWVALGTVSDMMPLRGENRILVKRGLRAIPLSSHAGLRALCEVAGVDERDFGAEDIAFRIAPRLNAATRLGRHDISLELVTADDPARAQSLAQQLDTLNRQRQAQDRAMFEGLEPVLAAGDPDDLVVLRDDGWNTGLLGLVASRIVQQVGRPAVLVSGLQGDPAKGSMRSVDGFNAHEALAACSEHIVQHGGHAKAAGFMVELSRFDALAGALRERWAEHRRRGWKPPPIDYEGELPLASLTLKLMDDLGRLAPFGEQNPAPVLGARHVTVLEARRMGGDGRHLTLQLGQGPEQRRAVSFGSGDLADRLRPGQLVDVLFVPKVNRFRGRASVELELVDLRESRPAGRDAAASSRSQDAGGAGA